MAAFSSGFGWLPSSSSFILGCFGVALCCFFCRSRPSPGMHHHEDPPPRLASPSSLSCGLLTSSPPSSWRHQPCQACVGVATFIVRRNQRVEEALARLDRTERLEEEVATLSAANASLLDRLLPAEVNLAFLAHRVEKSIRIRGGRGHHIFDDGWVANAIDLALVLGVFSIIVRTYGLPLKSCHFRSEGKVRSFQHLITTKLSREHFLFVFLNRTPRR